MALDAGCGVMTITGRHRLADCAAEEFAHDEICKTGTSIANVASLSVRRGMPTLRLPQRRSPP
jgi:hypothetical protein